MRKNPTPAQKLLLYTYDNLVAMGNQYATNAVNVSRKILKDESMVASDKPEIMEFKKNLTMFVKKYESVKNPTVMWDVLDIYSNTTDYYLEISEEKVTPESKLIVDTLNKYNTKNVVMEFARQFIVFMDNFTKMFEENKMYLEKPMLDWYEKYKAITDVEEKIDAFADFIDLA